MKMRKFLPENQKCDNIDGTVTLVTLQNGAKFGGYNPSRWTSEEGPKNIPNTFLFSLTDGKGSGPQKWMWLNRGQAIYCGPGYGSVFGSGKSARRDFIFGVPRSHKPIACDRQ